MYHRVRRKMRLAVCAILILVPISPALPTIDNGEPQTKHTTDPGDNYENNVIDFDDEFSVKFRNKYEVVPWDSNSEKYVKDSHRYTIVQDGLSNRTDAENKTEIVTNTSLEILNESTTETDYSVIPLELISTTENYLLSIVESTADQDLSVIPLSTTTKHVPTIEINQTVTLPTSTQDADTSDTTSIETTTQGLNVTTSIVQTTIMSVPSTDKTKERNQTDETSEVTTSKTYMNYSQEKLNITLDITTERLNLSDTTKEEINVLETTTIKDDIVSEVDRIDSKDTEQSISSNVQSNYSDGIVKISNTSVTIQNNTTNTSETNKEVNKDNITATAVINKSVDVILQNITAVNGSNKAIDKTDKVNVTITNSVNVTAADNKNKTKSVRNSKSIKEIIVTNSTKQNENRTRLHSESLELDEKEVPVFTELDAVDEEVPEDYYDAKDVVPTTTPKTSALSVLVGLAGSVVESVVETVAERVVPKGIYDLFKRMQRQSEALEVERLRSREENGGLGQFGRGILKSISSGLSGPLSQLMAGAKDIGSLDTDRGFVSSLASGVTSVASVATTLADSFKDRVQAIYPGTVWCGDGHSATARSGELGLFFFTDTCCRQHDACKIYIRAGDTKYGLTNTGLFTRSHCSCDAKFRECLRRTNSLVSAQIGLTYFNVLGPQCFRKAHPIVKCLKRTRLTGQKCEEYEFDYTKPKMWQWFDNETF